MKGERILRIAGWALVGVAAALGLGLVLGLVVQALWNWLMPKLFGLPEITYWQAVGLFVLCHLLFGSHGNGSSHTQHTHHDHPLRERLYRAVRGAGEPATPAAPAAPPVDPV
ncbi:MAG: hypothetical protein ABIL09_29140 [Gemmatimonadota bacterium]